MEIADTNKWLDGFHETVETAEKPTDDPQVKREQAEVLKVGSKILVFTNLIV